MKKKRRDRRDKLEKLRDWIIWYIINELNDQTLDIRVVFKKPRGVGSNVIGLVTPMEGYYLVHIDPSLGGDKKIRIFLHEVLHIVFNLFGGDDDNDNEDDEEERATGRLEDILWSLLTDKERKMFEGYMYRLVENKRNKKRRA